MYEQSNFFRIHAVMFLKIRIHSFEFNAILRIGRHIYTKMLQILTILKF